MNIKSYLAISASVLALQCGSAQAQDFYLGFGLAATDGEGTDQAVSFNAGPIHWNSTSAIAGVRFQTAGPMFYGAELDTTLGLNGNFDASVDRVSRLRALVGYKFDKYSLFAALGAVRTDGPTPPGLPIAIDGNADGHTIGLGIEIPVSDRIDIRAEVIYDDQTSSAGYIQDYTTTTIRVGAIIKF